MDGPTFADVSSSDWSSSESATSPSPKTPLGLFDEFELGSGSNGREDPSTLLSGRFPGPSLIGDTSTTLLDILGGARRALIGRAGARRSGCGGGGEESRDRCGGGGGGSSSESLCGGGGGANAGSGEGDLARAGGGGGGGGGEGSLGGGDGSRCVCLAGAAAGVSPASALRTASDESPVFAARASCWRNAFVCSGSSPATIFSGRAVTFSLSASPTHAMILASHAVLLSLSLTLPESVSVASNSPRANPVLRVTSDTTSWRNLNGGFFSKFSVSCEMGKGQRSAVVTGRNL